MWPLILLGALVLVALFWDFSGPEAAQPVHTCAPRPDSAPLRHADSVSETTRPTVGRRVFFVRFWPTLALLFSLFLSGLVIALELWSDFRAANLRDWIVFGVLASLVGLPGATIASLFVRQTGKVTVEDAGLADGVPWLRRVYVPWNDMQVSESKFLLLFPALTIRSRSTGRKFWLLRSVYMQSEFQQTAVALAILAFLTPGTAA